MQDSNHHHGSPWWVHDSGQGVVNPTLSPAEVARRAGHFCDSHHHTPAATGVPFLLPFGATTR